jgi:hypothetical protein
MIKRKKAGLIMKSFKGLKFFLFILLISILVSCGSRGDSSSSEGYNAEDAAMEEVQSERKAEYGGTANEVGTDQEIRSTDRMVIYNANLSLEVKDYHKIEATIQDRVAALGGYVVESAIYHSGEDWINGNLVVKVPQKNFHPFINEVESTSVKVNERQISGNDVTEEYIDLESRLRSKRVVEERLLSFMAKAEKTEDLLKISKDLGSVQEEIEQLLGRMNYLKTNVDYSTITIHLSERLVTVPSIKDSEALNTWDKAQSMFMGSVNTLISFFSGIIVLAIGLSPIVVPIGLIAFVILLLIRRKRNNKPFEG